MSRRLLTDAPENYRKVTGYFRAAASLSHRLDDLICHISHFAVGTFSNRTSSRFSQCFEAYLSNLDFNPVATSVFWTAHKMTSAEVSDHNKLPVERERQQRHSQARPEVKDYRQNGD
jgi:hypothetical protein